MDSQNEDGYILFQNLKQFIRSFVVLSDDSLTAVALWSIHTHAIESAIATPYLNIFSPQKQCGKTRLLEVLALLVARPWFTARTSAAALIRKVARDKPTLLLDETDAAFKSDKEYVEVLRGILNAGNQRGGKATICVGKGHDVHDFEVFGPKALSGIGALPDTVADRSIRIEMKRRLRTEDVRRFRRREAQSEGEALRERIEVWALAHGESLAKARPFLPDELSDRAQEGWEPLLSIAALCAVAEDAAVTAVRLSGFVTEPEDHGLRALADLRSIFGGRDRMPSCEVVAKLRAIKDGPYGPSRGRHFDERDLARRLKPFAVGPEQLRIGERNVRGYARGALAELWTRYLPADEAE